MPKQKPKPTGDAVIDAIALWRYDNCPALTVDVILSRPLDAMKMGLAVAAATGQISPHLAGKIAKVLDRLVKSEGRAIDAIDDVCRKAINARKKGLLKPDRV